MEKKVISRKNLPTTSPLPLTILLLLAIDYWHAPEWLKGIVYFVIVIVWISKIVKVTKEIETNIFKNKFNEKTNI